MLLQNLQNLPLWQGVLETVIYAFIGIIMATIAYKLIDFLTPGKLSEQIAKEGNIALAILAGSMIIGLCIIIAQAMN